jgi:hypothetical protein
MVNDTNGALNTLVKLHPAQYSNEMLSENFVEEIPSTQEFMDRIDRLVSVPNRSQVHHTNKPY